MFFKYFSRQILFQGLFKTVIFIQVLFKPVRTLVTAIVIDLPSNNRESGSGRNPGPPGHKYLYSPGMTTSYM